MSPKIWIISGEGDGEGTRELYSGSVSARALKARLTRERSGGDRWARLEVELDGCPPERCLPYQAVEMLARDPAAVALGRKGGKKGGPARAKKMTAEERSESARKAVTARWQKVKLAIVTTAETEEAK